jgi:GAF domain-containing protein
MTMSEAAEAAATPEAAPAPDGELLAEQVADRPDDLALALTELSGVLLDDEGLESTLQRVATLACRTMPGCTAAGVTLVAGDGTPETAAITHDVVLEVDRRQYDAGDGPCIDALRERRINSAGRAEAHRRWPEFAARAEEVGFSSFLAAPLIAGEVAIGALNLYSSSPDGFEELDDALIALFSGQASVALANARLYRSARKLSEQLQEALASRAVIEQAKGILMAQHRIGADAAFDLLRERSQQVNRKLREVAREVVDGIH